jgi:hypothetical protein
MVRIVVERDGGRLVVDGIQDDDMLRCLVEEVCMCLRFFEVEVVF